MIDILIKFGLLVWPFGHFLDIRLGDITLSSLDILVILIIFFSIPLLIKNIGKLEKDPASKALFLFLTISILSLLARIPETGLIKIFTPSLYLFRLILYLSLFFVFKLHPLKRYLDYLKVSLVTFIFFGLLQYIVSPNMSFIKYIGFDDHYYRLIGTFLDPNFTGAIFSALSVFLISSGYLKSGLLILIPLALTFSRASFVSLLFPLITYSLTKKKALLIAIPIIVTVVLLLAPKPYGEGVNLLRTFSIFSRIDSAQQGIGLFLQRPLLGWGFNTLISDSGRIGIDNSFIFLLATTGILGLLSFLYFLYTSFHHRSSPLKLTILSILIHSLFNNTLFFPHILIFMVVMATIDEKSP